MSPVVVVTSAYGASLVGQLGQAFFIPMVARAGATGIEIRRELFQPGVQDFAQLGRQIEEQGLFAVYSAPLELWQQDGSLAHSALAEVIAEAVVLKAHYLKVSLGHFSAESDLTVLNEVLSQAPLQLLIENDQTEHGGRIDGLAQFFGASSAAALPVGMTFDIGNWHWAGVNPAAAADALAPYVRYVHCKGVVNDGGKLKAIPLSASDTDWRALFARFPRQILRAIEFPLIGADLDAVTTQHVAMLKAA